MERGMDLDDEVYNKNMIWNGAWILMMKYTTKT
jgi:hypothetical protein